MHELEDDADAALEELRSLVRGIYPPLLVDRGLRDALSWAPRGGTLQTRSTPTASVAIHPTSRPRSTSAASRRSRTRPSSGQRARAIVRLRKDGDDLVFDVSDDGTGFRIDDVTKSGGLTNMRDRVGAAGGSLEITSAPGGNPRPRRRAHHSPLPASSLMVVVAEDDYLIREADRSRPRVGPGYAVAASCADGDGAPGRDRPRQPDVVVTDIRMPPSGADEGIRVATGLRRDPSAGRGAGPQPVRRAGVRARAARRRDPTPRLPAQGARPRPAASSSARSARSHAAGRRSTPRSSRGSSPAARGAGRR